MKMMKGLKRPLSFLMCIIMVFGMLPLDAISVTLDDSGAAVYEIGDTVWVRGEDGEPDEASAENTFWLPVYDDNDQPVTKQGLCEKTEHTHAYVCAENCELIHIHNEACYSAEYTGCVIHTHDENCTTETVYDCGKEVHENHDGCTAAQECTLEAHDHAAMACQTQVSFTCTEEHEHTVEAGCASETVYTCGKDNHAHEGENCNLVTVYDCGKELHTHENCTTSVRYVDCVEHAAHDENCVTEQKLSCGKEAHTCVTEGCAPDCAIEAHTHTEECDMEGVYYKWVVVEDTSSTLEGEQYGLPIHFFIAEPGQAVYPNGSYVNYKESYWGSNNDSDYSGAYAKVGTEDFGNIKSEQGIRNANDENLIITHVAKWPDGFTESTMKDFGSITIDGVTYSQNDYDLKWVTICYRQGYRSGVDHPCYCRNKNYNHIHIDGILSKKVTPAEMKLTKEIPAAQETQEVFNFTLTRLQQDASYNPTQNVDTTFGTNGSITLTATIPAGQTTASIVSSTGEEIGFGYYKLEEVVNDRWQTSAIEITRNNANSLRYSAGPVYIQIATDGTLRYSSTYNGTYTTATNITIENERLPLNVTYSWEGIPDDHAVLPEKASVAPESTYSINSSYPIGARVRGKEGTAYEGKYYEFMGWQYYDPESGERQYITYENGAMNPSTITVNSDTNIHGLWAEHDLPTADGYVTLTKTFVNKPADAELKNFYIAVLHDGHETDITPSLVGTWNEEHTQWTYNFAISMSGTYTFVEGKYDIAGYDVATNIQVVPTTGIGEDMGAYTSADFITDGHNYKEVGRVVKITLPYNTSVVSDTAAQADDVAFHAATVNFTNTYDKRILQQEDVLPDFRVRKMDSGFLNTLTGAEFTLTGTEGVVPATPIGDSYVYYKLDAGTYSLVETKAPDGYVKDNTVYTVIVEKNGEAVEELRVVCTDEHVHNNACYSYVPVQNYTVRVTDANGVDVNDETSVAPGVFNADPEVRRLNIPNEQIKGDLNISKSFTKENSASFTPSAGSILVDIYGPVVRDDSGKITDIGPLVRTGLSVNAPTWTLSVEDLPYGEYLVEEIMASVHGYTWKGATFQIDGANAELYSGNGHSGAVISVKNTTDINLSITNQYDTWQSADFYILKENLNGDELAGAKFALYDADNKDVTDKYLDKDAYTVSKTNANGILHFRGFEVDEGKTLTLTLKETVAPEGYYLTTNTYLVTVTHTSGAYDITVTNADGSATGAWNSNDDLLTVVDMPILGQITVNKSLRGDEIPEGSYMTFTLLNADGSFRKTVTLTAADKWTYTFTDLPLGSYTISETYASVDGFTYSTTYKVGTGADTTGTSAAVTLEDNSDNTLTEGTPDGAKATVTFTNTYDRQENLVVTATNFTVIKRGENEEPLAKAKFELFVDEKCTTKLVAPTESFTVAAETDSYGMAHFNNLKLADLAYAGYITSDERSATYYLKETVAPENHIANGTVWKITITEDKVQVDELNSKNVFETVVDWIVGIFVPNGDGTYTKISGNALTVVNNRIKGDLTITKEFAGVTDADALDDARVEIHVHGPITRGAGGSITDIGPLVENINLSGKDLVDGKLTYVVRDLEIGEYVLREPFASIHGYSWDDVVYSGITEEEFNEMYFAAFTVDKATPDLSITVKNTYSEWQAADFYVNKVKDLTNLNDGIAGAKFQLYTDPECKNVATSTNDNPITVWAETGVAGYAHFSGFKQAGTYYLKEITTPDNYYPTNNIWKVVIGYDADEKTYTTNITLLEGITADAGWSWNGDLDVLNVVNREVKGSITITKAITGDQPGLNKIMVELVGNGINQEIELSADKGWTATIDELPMGNYAIVEQDANVDGYTLTTTYYEGDTLEGTATNPASYAQVTLDDTNKQAPVVSVKIQNKYEKQKNLTVTPASFTVRKVDAEDITKLLDNATFHLYKVNDDNSIMTIATETTVNGIATFDNLKMPDRDYDDYTNQGSSVIYYLAETAAPDGYTRDDTVWKVELSENIVKFDKLSEDKSVFEIIVNWVAGLFKPTGTGSSGETLYTKVSGTELTVSNQRIKGDLTITKTFTGVADATKARVEIHVHGPITRNAEGTITDIGPLVENINLSGKDLKDGKLTCTVQDLEIGEYVLREPFASIHGYTWKDVVYADGTSVIRQEPVSGMDNTVKFAAFSVDAGTPDISIGVTNNYEVWQSADFFVNKVKDLNDLNDGISGARFQLYTDAACTNVAVSTTENPITVWAETGIAGYAHFTGFKVDEGKTATYYLKEIKAPEHYYPTSNTWKVVIGYDSEKSTYTTNVTLLENTTSDVDWSWNGELDVLNVENEEIRGSITIKKVITGDIPADLNKIVVKLSGNGINRDVELTAAKGWITTVDDLPLGTYTVTEDAAAAKVAGYDLMSVSYAMDGAEGNSVTFTDADHVAELVITNLYDRREVVVNNPDQFTIYKTDEVGTALSGAKFRLTNDDNPTQVRDFVTGADGKVIVDNLIGFGSLTSAESTSYTLEEIQAPTGHELPNQRTWKIAVDENGGEIIIKLNEETNNYETIWDWIVGKVDSDTTWNKDTKTLTVKNTRKTIRISVSKLVEFAGLADPDNDERVKALKDTKYTFELYVNGSSTALETVTVAAGETKTFETKLPYGSTYEVREVRAADAAYTVVYTQDNEAGTVDEDALNGITVEAKNLYTFEDVEPLKLDMVKVSSDSKRTPLSGAKFSLYNSKNEVVGTYVSDKDGKFQITEIAAPGEYTLKETAAPSGYYKLSKAITITASYQYTAEKDANNNPVTVKSLVAVVAGEKVYEISDNTYGIKNTKITDSPKTGDNENLLMWTGMFTISLMSMCVMFLMIPKKKGKYQR